MQTDNFPNQIMEQQIMVSMIIRNGEIKWRMKEFEADSTIFEFSEAKMTLFPMTSREDMPEIRNETNLMLN
uniref:Uncharacterized protein n=1 Tax=Onchocerca volvulus TaxID=6282 RepID=A0A8R1U0D1_ONCVO